MGTPPNAPWPHQPGPGGQPPYGPPPGGLPPGGFPPGLPGPPPPGRRGGAGLALALIGGGLVIVLIIVGVVVLALQGGDDDKGGGAQLRVGKIAGGAEAIPLSDGSLVMARPGVTGPVVDVYEDFACPPCGAFDRMHDPMLKEMAVAGRAKIVFHPMVVFGESTQPAHGNSLRAAAALRCVGDGAHWLSYQDALYAHQPADHDTEGYAIGDLISYAAPLGLTGDDFTSCVKSQRHAESVKQVSQGYLASGVQGTPSVRVNGTMLGTSATESPDALRRAIAEAS
ncbi:DsbA family protein [Actinomadura formosensis]|uniref:DsbA family protein n=1 Tax=Actinomadura formosensis TaxID=60706 RepID=UPI00082B910D|nr:DsbA family protein [Actinomadura formosensis]